MNTKMFSIIGGDYRNIKLAELLSADGHEIDMYGFENIKLPYNINKVNDIFTAVNKSKYIIGPIPLSLDDISVNAPFHTGEISIKKIIEDIYPEKTIIAGKISDKIMCMAESGGVRIIDILKREDMCVMNAIPTAEGALQIAMEETEKTICNSKCLIIGYGRIGKTLSRLLMAVGAEVTCSARKYEDIAWIEANGYRAVKSDDIENIIGSYDIIFNTVPALVLNRNLLDKANRESLIIDLASSPGGTDFSYAESLGIQTKHALSLPGIVAPVTAAEYIKKTIYNIIRE